MNYHYLKELENHYGSSFYFFDEDKFVRNFLNFYQAFHKRYENVIVGYSYKTNYLPYLCKIVDQHGGYAEVVSRLEYELALKIGVDSKKIIFNGPLKSYEDIQAALDGNSLLNLDSMYEIDYVEKYHEANPEKPIKVGIRVNFDLTINNQNPLQNDHQVSRFGFCAETEALKEAISKLKRINNVQIVGLHGHFSTSTRSLEVYKKITQKLCKLAKTFIPDTLMYLDVGGGFYGELPTSMGVSNVPTFDDYAENICSILNKEFSKPKQPTLILEPGISIVANTFKFISKVIDVKKVRNHLFVLIHGSVHNVKPTMHRKNLPMTLIPSPHPNPSDGVYHIVGYTCMEKDYISENVRGTIPMKDDFLIFDQVGAYTIVFNPPFIKERPPIITKHNNKILVVRKQETLTQFLNEDLYLF